MKPYGNLAQLHTIKFQKYIDYIFFQIEKLRGGLVSVLGLHAADPSSSLVEGLYFYGSTVVDYSSNLQKAIFLWKSVY